MGSGASAATPEPEQAVLTTTHLCAEVQDHAIETLPGTHQSRSKPPPHGVDYLLPAYERGARPSPRRDSILSIVSTESDGVSSYDSGSRDQQAAGETREPKLRVDGVAFGGHVWAGDYPLREEEGAGDIGDDSFSPSKSVSDDGKPDAEAIRNHSRKSNSGSFLEQQMLESPGAQSPAGLAEVSTVRASLHTRGFVALGDLGSGSSGHVLKALHLDSLTLVALKTLPAFSRRNRTEVVRELRILHNNLKLLSAVNESLSGDWSASHSTAPTTTDASPSATSSSDSTGCPHLLGFYNVYQDETGGMVTMVTEFMDGGSLQDLVNEGGCNNEAALASMAYQLLQGLKALHDHSLLHRDVKPGNVLLNSQGYVKLADFGLARQIAECRDDPQTFIGTTHYMSPERLLGEAYGPEADVWSLGLTILAVALGKFPFKLDAQQQQTPTPPSKEAQPAADSPQQPVPAPGGPNTSESTVHSDFMQGQNDNDGKTPSSTNSATCMQQPSKSTSQPEQEVPASQPAPMLSMLGRSESDYWSLLEATCDTDVPQFDASGFSAAFQTFVRMCVHRQPSDRATVSELLQSEFVRMATVPSAELSSVVLEHQRMYRRPKVEAATGSPFEAVPVDSSVSRASTAAENTMTFEEQRFMVDRVLRAVFTQYCRSSKAANDARVARLQAAMPGDHTPESSGPNAESRVDPSCMDALLAALSLPGLASPTWTHLAQQMHVPPALLHARVHAVFGPIATVFCQ